MRGGQAPAQLVIYDDRDAITLRPERATADDPIICRQWDLGAPEVRSSTADRAHSDGTIDRAGYTGSRTVTFDLQILGDRDGSAYAYAERLTAMCHPSRRPVLRASRSTPEAYGQTWEMLLRGNPFSVSYGRRAAALLEMQLSFTAPMGYLEGDNQGYESAQASANATTGIVFPEVMPLSIAPGTAANPLLTLRVGGSAPIHPVLYFFGPAVNPEIRSDDGERFKFTSLTLSEEQFVQVDMATGTVLLNGDPAATIFHLVDFSASTYWTWDPGVHVVRYLATSGRMAVHWRDRRFTI